MEFYIDLELVSVVLSRLSLKHWKHFEETQERGELDNAIFHGRIALGLCPEELQDFYEMLLGRLGSSLHRRFEQYGRLEDLTEAIEHNRAGLRLRPNNQTHRLDFLITLTTLLQARFEQHGNTTDLSEAIELHRAALQLRPDGRLDRSISLNNLAISLQIRFEQNGQTADLNEAIELNRAALQLRPLGRPNRSSSLSNLAKSLHTRFEQYGQTADLNEAIELNRAAQQLRPVGHPDRSMSLNNLASSLQTRFEQHGQTSDLYEAIELNRAALQLRPDGHPDRYMSLNNLANSLRTRFKQHGQAADLDEAIEMSRTALQLHPDGHPNRSTSLNNLAISLQIRFEQNGQNADIDEAIELNRATLRLYPDGHPNRSGSLNNLASSLHTRFGQKGQTADLNEAIELHRDALQLRPIGHPYRFESLSNLALSLRTRFQQYGQTADLDEAIELHRATLRLYPDDHPNHNISLDNLAGSLTTRFGQNWQTADLDEAIELHRASLRLYPDGHPNRSRTLSNLAHSLHTRFKLHRQTADLDEAIELNRDALRLHPNGHRYHSISLDSLASSLQSRFEQHGQTADLGEAIELHHAALQFHADGHPDRPISLINMAISLHSRFTKFGHADDLEDCIKSLECAAEYKFSSLVVCLEAAKRWAKFARDHSHHTTSRAYKVVMLLLQRVLIISPTLYSQHDFLSRKHDYTSPALDAVAYAIEEDRLKEAIEILEQGRGLLWSQMRGFRTPLDRLADTNGELAERFKVVSQQLENLATSSGALQYNLSTAESGLSELDKHRERILSEERLKLKKKLSSEQEELIKEIRQIPGLESFLTATPFEELQRVALEGPVIVVNLSRYRSDVLIVLSREDLPVICVPLDEEFGKDSVTLCIELLETRVNLKVFSPQYDAVLQRAMGMLWDRVVSKVVRKLKEVGIMEGSRIWWCPTSFLSILPFHAAGPFRGAEGRVKYLLDDYVSSYTPTLGALINARLRENASNPKMLIVGDTKTLKSTKAEILAVRNNTRSYVSSYAIHINKEALRNTVIKGLQDVTWIHFACHGSLASGSFDSSFNLSDGGLTLLDIIRAKIPDAEFAFLSACHTAEQSRVGTFDEVLHLAAAMQFSGFRSVIGTMWEMYDPDGPLLAREVYSYMGYYEDGEVIHKRSAAALRQAVLALRGRDGVTTERWVNMVHIGA